MTKYLPHTALSVSALMTYVLSTTDKITSMLPAWEAWAVGVGLPAFVAVVSWISQEAQNWKGLKNLNITDLSSLISRVSNLESAVKNLPLK